MRPIKLFLFISIIVPFLFVMGTIASEATSLGPITIGTSHVELSSIAQAGKALKVATGDLTMKEISLIRTIINSPKMQRVFSIDENLHRIKMLADRSV